MKKVLFVCLAVFIGIMFVANVFAQTPEKKETTTTTTTTTTKVAKTMTFTGQVTNMDTEAKMMTVKNKKGEKTFDVSNAKMKVEPKAGHKVTVKYMEMDGKMMASSVTVSKATKAKKAKKGTTTKTTTTETTVETTTPAK